MATDSPIFIGGAGRSGTTLLRVMLDSHPSICCGPELKLTPQIAQWQQSINNSMTYREVMRSYGNDAQRVNASFRAMFDTLVENFLHASGKRRWAEKTPHNVVYMDALGQIYPNARFIHVIRDGRDVACSLQTMNWTDTSGKPLAYCRNIRDAARYWNEVVRAALNQAKMPSLEGRVLVVRYEQLLANSETVMHQVLEFLDEPWDESVLSHHEHHTRRSFERMESSTAQVAEPVHQKAKGRWEKDMSQNDRRIFAEHAGTLLCELGYADLHWLGKFSPQNTPLVPESVSHVVPVSGESASGSSAIACTARFTSAEPSQNSLILVFEVLDGELTGRHIKKVITSSLTVTHPDFAFVSQFTGATTPGDIDLALFANKVFRLTVKCDTSSHPEIVHAVAKFAGEQMTEPTQPPVRYRLGEDSSRSAHSSWYRGTHCNFIPSRSNYAEEDAVDHYVLAGWTPPAPVITRDSYITAFGSCFAAHVSKYLKERGYKVGSPERRTETHIISHGAGINNTFALRQQFEWALGGRNFSDRLWHDKAGQFVGYSDDVREETRRIFEQTDVFILTLGLSEIWCNKHTQEVFWRAIPRDQFDESMHGFRVSSVAENTDNLEAIYQLIRKTKPDATIVLTVSPVPLVATFRPVSCITANSVSKAVLRVAADELVQTHDDDPCLFYWPSYEIVTTFCSQPYQEDNRHIKPEVVAFIMDKFRQHYLVS
jgi:hypothetical protein